MALNKRQYTDGQTIVTAANLNEIQDCIITLENNYVPKTRTVAGKALSSNITLAASDVGAVPTSRTINSKALTGNITLSAADVGAVPVARTVNGKALSSNITLSAADVSAVPTTRKVNNKALSADISLTASDVGAVPTGRTVNGKALSSNITLAAGDIGYDSSAMYSASTVGKALSDMGVAINNSNLQVTPYVETGSTASRNYSKGDCIIYNGLLYSVLSPISSGATFTPNTNIAQVYLSTVFLSKTYIAGEYIFFNGAEIGLSAANNLVNVIIRTERQIPSNMTFTPHLIVVWIRYNGTTDGNVEVVGAGRTTANTFTVTVRALSGISAGNVCGVFLQGDIELS